MFARRAFLGAAIWLVSCATAPTRTTPARYSVATQGEATTRAAERILAEGGNLFDAAVAASLVISVERPHSTGLGGGGFWLSYHAGRKEWVALDFRERAPARIRLPQKLLKENPKAIPPLLQDTALGGGVPGLVAGLGKVHARYGKLSWSRIVEPAIELAEGGFEVYPALAEALEDRRGILAKDPETAAIFLHADGSPLKAGELLIQTELGHTLRQIAREGAESFYRGALARKIATALQKAGSPIRADDLSHYQVIERTPIRTRALGHTLYLMPPPSSGGIVLSQILRHLEPHASQLQSDGLGSEKSLHRIAQAMQLAFADRAQYLGDPKFTRIPQERLLSGDYLESRRKKYFSERAIPAKDITPEGGLATEGSDTTHISMIDREGNAIATTQSINGWMGAGQVIHGTGILLNNTMDDFSVAAGVRNLFGAVGSDANRLRPGKTPLSSMTPTIVSDGKPELVIGAPGGTRIITCVAQTLLQHWLGSRSLKNAVASPRIHQQWSPDEIVLEDPAPVGGFSDSIEKALKSRGHTVRRGEVHCRVMAASLREAVSDPRDFGSAVTGD